MKLSKLEKKLLIDLFKSSEGLFIFTLYQRYNLSPKELFLAVNGLIEHGLINSDGERIIISKDGISYAINSKMKTSEKRNKHDKIPENFLGQKIEINQFYIPKIDVPNY